MVFKRLELRRWPTFILYPFHPLTLRPNFCPAALFNSPLNGDFAGPLDGNRVRRDDSTMLLALVTILT
ncbi:hypothetical protein [Nitrospira sp. Nam80]